MLVPSKRASLVRTNSNVNRELTPTLFRSTLAGMMQKSGSERPMDGIKVLGTSWQAINVEELYEGEIRLTPQSTVGGFAVAALMRGLLGG